MLNIAAVAASVVLAAMLTLGARLHQENGDLVTLDVAVVDEKGRAIAGLTAHDFTIKEDGTQVGVTTFSEMSPIDPDVHRSLVLLMDDMALGVLSADAMKTVANAVVDNLSPRDEVAVVRLSRNDVPFGDRAEARFRIGAFRPGLVPFNDQTVPRESLRVIASTARQLQISEGHRTVLLCIGAGIVCNIAEPTPSSPFYSDWLSAISETARANVAVYSFIAGRGGLRAGGIAALTGGEVFAANYDLTPAVLRVLQDANRYYMLGYWPAGRDKAPHRIEVKVARKGAKVHVRRLRGN